ncbi:hypothetical protein CXG81DRAFT_13691 [Caulochytrium protostelioides]|uniref:Peptidyl-prolyl cis-trans isomerase n=1 Tax=Caulochytrium protostelioides TaxID=1555241 RepID=A0A4P9WYE3_9FUNG|nr:hypothetical protein CAUPRSCDRAFT_6326 [Caulochytrium protostelioides]RKP00050.1 hypothetical protein CXG81DRAFT_13691 [Caulochytrium protostelioides]|eukprot:RKP00050.1 hypothetical protein CXG81DRAFT_13691 [Caulochytrium protostelioides]
MVVGCCLAGVSAKPRVKADPKTPVDKVTQKLVIEVTYNGDQRGNFTVGLFGETVPKTAKNFYELCVSKTPGEGYVGSTFHRIIREFMLQGGDFTNGDGTGGKSIYGETFSDENFKLHHSTHGLLSMANRGPNTQSSQFFITTEPTAWLDGRHVVFGQVLENMSTIMALEDTKTNYSDRPTQDVTIQSCTDVTPDASEPAAAAQPESREEL